MEACPVGNNACLLSPRSPCCGAFQARRRMQVKCASRQVFHPSRLLGGQPLSSRSPKHPPSRHCHPPCILATIALPPRRRSPEDSDDEILPPDEILPALAQPTTPPAAMAVPSFTEEVAPPLFNEEVTASFRAKLAERLSRSPSLGDASSSSPAGGRDSDLVDVSCDRTHASPTLVLMRHGESMWNDLKLFTGDVDIPLTEKGVMEALDGGRSVADIDFSTIFTSRLMRSKQTALLAMTQNVHKGVPVIVRGGYHGNGQTGDANRLRLRAAAAQALKQAECRMIPVYADPALNERCYGDLQGLNKEAAERTFGQELVKKWRRSHNTRPPRGESLEDTWERTLGFFMATVEPLLGEGKNILVVAHGNVLRCIISYLCELKEEEMLRLQIATALPYAFSYNEGSYAQCCVLPPIDPKTGGLMYGKPMGLTSAIQKGAMDSLI